MKLGIVSDTHGLMRPQVLATLADACVDHILHVGDVGDPAILDQLAVIAPTTAIRGNIDTRGPCVLLPETEVLELAGRLIYLVHSIQDLDLDPVAAGISLVLSGHSHRSSVEQRGPVLYLNPGSCGPRRFRFPVTMALAEITSDRLDAWIVEVDVNP